jgi:hypothetical protein
VTAACERKRLLRRLAAMDVTTAAARDRAASLWSRRAVDLCRVATCLCRMP